jgi:putative addiction module CopG family antidote
MKENTVSDTLSLDQFVEQQLKSGTYPSYEAMVKAGLKLLQDRDQEAQRIADELRPAYERFKRGDPGLSLDADETIRRGKERNAAKHRRMIKK